MSPAYPITPYNSNMFFIPSTKFTFSCISDTNVNTSNLCPYTSIITGITNNTATHCPLPTWTLCIDEANFGNAWSDLIAYNRILIYRTY